MPKTPKRHTAKAASSAHLHAYLNEGHSADDLALLLHMHVTTVNGWLSAPDTAPAWTETITEQRTKLREQRALLAGKTKNKICFIYATNAQADKLDKILDIVDLKVTWIDQ